MGTGGFGPSSNNLKGKKGIKDVCPCGSKNAY